MIQTTLNFLIKDKQILLAMKKRGFGINKWNGVGGKLQDTETPIEAIIRETEEEIGVQVATTDIEKVGTITFHFPANPNWDNECHVFITKKWIGEPVETEEMCPAWYYFGDIPYDAMWVSDKAWLPLILEGKKITATFQFNNEGDTFDSWSVEEN